MKLSNLSVIFIVVAIPLILLLSYYISLQRDTINLQTSYNTKLLESTKEAIEAFEINTVEWNEAYSETEDSKRRDIMAAINTFTTSLANNLGVAGTSKEYLLAHIPAVAFTLYDGCYIYTPSEVKTTVTDENGVTVRMSETVKNLCTDDYTYKEQDAGKILYKSDSDSDGVYSYTDPDGNVQKVEFTLDSSKADVTENKHVLKPFTAYTEILQDDWIISYTLDNYVTIYGEVDGKYTSESGYLNLISDGSAEKNVISIPEGNFEHNYNFADKNPLEEIKFSGQIIKPELLTETIAYKNGTDITTEKFNYVFEAEKDTKVYYEETSERFFRLNNDLEKVYIEDLTEPLYKKCTIPTMIDGKKNFLKVYQSLADKKWYVKDGGVYIVINDGDLSKEWDELLYHDSEYFTNVRYDYSAINYCVESYVFTNWVKNLDLKYLDGTTLKIEGDNDPEYEYSKFNEHKREIIKSVVVSNLNQAITSYSNNSLDEYKLPMLKETEWEQVLSNVSIITFLQNIPIGLKYYNNYAIATSTLNKEYVDPDEIYLYDQGAASDTIYHSPYCNKLDTTDNLIGYRSIDYIYKYYENKDKETKYYFRHSDETDKSVNQSCYYCLIQRSLYEKTADSEIEKKHKKAYYTALARERYLQLESITIESADISVTKTVDKTEVEYGDIVKYTITITNNATVNDSINIVDYYDGTMIKIDNDSINYNRTVAPIKSLDSYLDSSIPKINVNEGGTLKEYDRKYWKGINIEPGETITIELEATVEGPIGSIVKNTVGVYAYSTEETQIDKAEANSKIIKTVAIDAPDTNEACNIVMVLDHSNSMDVLKNGELKYKLKCLYNGVNIFLGAIGELFENEKSQLSIIHFNNNASTKYSCKNLKSDIEELRNRYNKNNSSMFSTGAGTNYNGALAQAETELQKMSGISSRNKNIVIFFTDGMPTKPTGQIGYAIQEDGTYKYEVISELGRLEANTGNGKKIWIDGDNPIIGNSYEGIKTIVDRLKTSELNAEIYCINCTNDDIDTRYGLKNIISSGEEKHYMTADDETGMRDAFESIAESIIPLNVQEPSPTSYGTIELDKVSKITAIYVGTNQLDSSELQIIKNSIEVTEDKGTLNLNEFPSIFHREGDIKVVY